MRIVLLLVLLVGLPLVGGFNYMRNAPLDDELKDRPYAGISDADLAALLAAYGKQVEHARAALTTEPDSYALNDPGRFGQYGEKVEAFEKFQRSNDQWKQARGQLFSEQTTLQALQREDSIRQRGLHRPLPRIWRRISTF
jgi:hypothetical protein